MTMYRMEWELPNDQPMSDKCICCRGPVNFTFNLVLSSRGAAPRRQHSSKAIGVCDSCCNPHSVAYGNLKTLVMMELWMNRNTHAQKLETIPGEAQPADRKTAAGGE